MPRDLPSNFSTPTVPPFLLQHAITLASWSTANKDTHLVVSGLIFRHSAPTHSPQILLVQRAAADSYPNFWETPGGSVDATDKTLLDALVREVWEETGLLVSKFGPQVWDAKEGATEVEFFGSRGEKWCKLNFLVKVEDGEVRLDAEEHQNWGWFEKEEIEGLGLVSKQAVEIAMNGFKAFDGK